MGGAGRFFQNRPKKTNSSNTSAGYLFKKIDVQYCLEKPFISVCTSI